MGVLGVLLIVFIVLKLVGVIMWSWWLVLMPLWITIGIYILFILFAGFLTAIGIQLPNKLANKKRK